MNKDDQIKGMSQLNRGSVGFQEALAKQEQGEPVAWKFYLDGCNQVVLDEDSDPVIRHNGTPLYTTPQPAQKPLTDEQTKMLNFLYGAGDWDGVWFEERHPTERGTFWWRKHLRSVFNEAAQGIKE